VLHLEHPRVAAPADGLRAGDDLARSSDEYVCWPPEQHGREAEELIATADTLFALGDYLVIGYEIPAV
jgi:hypothetical protein